MMGFLYDLHCHTIRSNDAVNTIFEIAAIARQKDVKLIAITDHGPGMVDGPHSTYFTISPRISAIINDVIILSGCEANIIDFDGNIDLSNDIASMQDIVIAGIHNLTSYQYGTNKSLNTKAIISTMRNQFIDVIAHPFRKEFPVYIEDVVEAAIKNQVLLELNTSLINTSKRDEEVLRSLREMISCCKSHNYPIVIGSDAHIAVEVGDFSVSNEVNIKSDILDVFDFERYDLRLHRRLSSSKKGFQKIIQSLKRGLKNG